MVTATTATTIAVADGTAATVVARMGKNTSTLTVESVDALTRQSNPSQVRVQFTTF